MAGFGSPCGACKFLRRKCVKGCVFAPYFCHEEGATHFASIHKVFGASNVSKLLMHLPVHERLEAAVTISYEAQARIQDPIYGCVSHIFALQKQVINLQAQLDSLKEQAFQSLVNSSTSSSSTEDKVHDKIFHPYQQDGHGLFYPENPGMVQPSIPSHQGIAETMLYYENGLMCPNSTADYHHSNMNEEQGSFAMDDDSSHPMVSLDMEMDTWKWELQDMEDLRTVAFAYLHHTR
ncbi:LOB domain-containing protein 29-like [Tasmannia lanceolata]|uniref:LOB domain-containing protein 29-like n=1 Tax=Tasmannia lanceolata TaxID=3420 RepID=UPI004064713B